MAYTPSGENNKRNPYYKKQNHVKLSRRDETKSAFSGAPVDPDATAPAAFAADDWTLTTGADPRALVLNISALPSDGGSAITALQYQIGAGPWAALSGTGTGARTLTMAAAGTSYSINLRAANAVDNGAASTAKTATSGAATVPGMFSTQDWNVETRATDGGATIRVVNLPPDNGSGLIRLRYTTNNGGSWTPFAEPAAVGDYPITLAQPNTAFNLRIGAVNGVGGGPQSEIKTVTSGEAAAVLTGAMWVGEYDDQSVMVSGANIAGSDNVRFVAVPVGGGAEIASAVLPVESTHRYAKTKLAGLAADTEYTLEMRSDTGVVAALPGTVKTRPTTRRAFAMTFSSCGERTRNHPIYEKVWTDNPDSVAFLYLGDRGYFDITSNNEALFHQYDSAALSLSNWATCHRRPTIWIWDDHDFGANNAIATSAVRPAAVGWARKRAPIDPVLTGASDPIYRVFSPMPGVKVALLDIRADRYSASLIIGAAQEAWLIGLIQGLAADEVLLIATMVPWHSSSDTDTWHGAGAIRQRIADAILQYAPGRVAALAGDAHMLAYADGASTPGNIPVCQAAPMGRLNSTKGGPWTIGPITATQEQYGRLAFTPVAGGWEVQFIGRSLDAAGVATERLNVSFTLKTPEVPADVAPTFDGASSISGGTAEGATITANPGPVSGVPAPTVSYAWRMDADPAVLGTSAAFARPAGVGGVPNVTITLANGVVPDATRVVNADPTTAAEPEPAGYENAVLATSPQFLLMEATADGLTYPDKSGNGRVGTVVGTQGSHLPAGPFGLPAFRGTATSSLQVAHDAAFNGTSWSLAFFVHPNDSTVKYLNFFSRGADQKFSYFNTSLTELTARFSAANSVERAAALTNDWNFVVLTFDAATGTGRTYVAAGLGALALSNTKTVASSLHTSSVDINFNGRLQTNGGAVDRRGAIGIAGMARWDRELSEAEISAIYNAATP